MTKAASVACEEMGQYVNLIRQKRVRTNRVPDPIDNVGLLVHLRHLAFGVQFHRWPALVCKVETAVWTAFLCRLLTDSQVVEDPAVVGEPAPYVGFLVMLVVVSIAPFDQFIVQRAIPLALDVRPAE
jgi:hypothetical protein